MFLQPELIDDASGIEAYAVYGECSRPMKPEWEQVLHANPHPFPLRCGVPRLLVRNRWHRLSRSRSDVIWPGLRREQLIRFHGRFNPFPYPIARYS